MVARQPTAELRAVACAPWNARGISQWRRRWPAPVCRPFPRPFYHVALPFAMRRSRRLAGDTPEVARGDEPGPQTPAGADGGAGPASHDEGGSAPHGNPVSLPPLYPAVRDLIAGKGLMDDSEAKKAVDYKSYPSHCRAVFSVALSRRQEYQFALDGLSVACGTEVTAAHLFPKGPLACAHRCLAWVLYVSKADAGFLEELATDIPAVAGTLLSAAIERVAAVLRERAVERAGHPGAMQADLDALLLHLWSTSVTIGTVHLLAAGLGEPHCFTPSPTANKNSKRWQIARLLMWVEERGKDYVMDRAKSAGANLDLMTLLYCWQPGFSAHRLCTADDGATGEEDMDGRPVRMVTINGGPPEVYSAERCMQPGVVSAFLTTGPLLHPARGATERVLPLGETLVELCNVFTDADPPSEAMQQWVLDLWALSYSNSDPVPSFQYYLRHSRPRTTGEDRLRHGGLRPGKPHTLKVHQFLPPEFECPGRCGRKPCVLLVMNTGAAGGGILWRDMPPPTPQQLAIASTKAGRPVTAPQWHRHQLYRSLRLLRGNTAHRQPFPDCVYASIRAVYWQEGGWITGFEHARHPSAEDESVSSSSDS